jgi:putative hydrolase of the HAD superfamily
MNRQHLIIDADDTLWENNIYFEQAFDRFCEILAHSHLSPAEIRDILDDIELESIKVNGYGATNFARNLCQCYGRLCQRNIEPGDLDRIMQLATHILEQPIEIIRGVPETLEYLGTRHELTLFTKGQYEEQMAKIERSGLANYFHHTAIVREKDQKAYSNLARNRGMDPDRTWMTGNSPKSDINPALSAGLRAVYVPHPRTWHLEHMEVTDHNGRLLILERFSDLREYF